ncbi:hypothetical protein SAMN04487897_107171 [Paenibacillus sp. yr247]|uniref:hypothetical protein n=1 Tax=Paenibacillus sp. yr247 TaxID=1761880 RepID=UPI0008821273|nr:hypothetical protein [Paenibacillus sp. yr247]SDO04257.1 hypothetical protein SAMN04487897_107171 [Paenibacillus sp. yr247]
MTESKAIQRILDKLNRNDFIDLLSERVSLSDLNTLLLELFRKKTSDTSYGDLLRNYSANRFVQPAELNPIALKQMEIHILKIAQSYSYQAMQLSPVAPLGSCSVVATSDQNKIISALRGTEVVADATNVLALHICDLLKKGTLKNNDDSLRFSTTHRHVRAQKFSNPGSLTHFNLFCMVASGRDRGSYSFEKETLAEHISVYQKVFSSLYNTNIKVRLKRLAGYTDANGFMQRLSLFIKDVSPEIIVIEDESEGNNQYYKGLQFTVIVNINGKEINIGDGGFVDWSQKLLGNKKERMMISAIGLDRLLNLPVKGHDHK